MLENTLTITNKEYLRIIKENHSLERQISQLAYQE